MYLYYNAKGILQEVVNDIPLRQTNSNVNYIYVYIEGASYDTENQYYPLPTIITQLGVRYAINSGAVSNETLVNTQEIAQIPYEKKRDLKKFKYFTNYQFFKISVGDDILAQNGTVACTVRAYDTTKALILALGLITFIVEVEVGITADTSITQAQFNYLMSELAKYTNGLQKVNTPNIVYGNEETGKPYTYKVSENPNVQTIPLWGSGRTLKVLQTLADEDCTNKKYTDTHYVAKSTEPKTIYAIDTNGNTYQISYTNDGWLENAVPVYDENGNLYGATPTQQEHLVNKIYCDNTIQAQIKILNDLMQQLLFAKLDKTGGTITGSLVITQDLQVNGTTTTTDTETLKVKDNIIMTNADGTELTALSGIAIRTNATDVYGIVYDKTSDSVKLGLGKIVDNQFVFNEGEGNAVAIRSDSELLIDNHIIIWDATNHLFKDSGKTINDFASKNTTANSLMWQNNSNQQTSLPFKSSILTNSDDLNTITTYGVYQIYSASLPSNIPTIDNVPLVNNAILTIYNPVGSQHILQHYATHTGKMFERYGQNVSGSIVWRNWMQIATSETTAIRARLYSSSDLNSLLTYGIYNIYNDAIPQNVPTGLNENAILTSFIAKTENRCLQIIYTASNKQYQRYTNDGTTWSAWTQTATTDYVDNAINNAVVSAINKAY